VDLTVADAESLRDFYAAVAGWRAEPVAMGGYDDYVMAPAGGEAAAGICHARGTNAALPAQWLIYIVVADLEASLAECVARGGRVVREPRGAGGSRFAIIEDPAGAVAALSQAANLPPHP
jgi:predicted enzyme related to lactoylglutathione lyase